METFQVNRPQEITALHLSGDKKCIAVLKSDMSFNNSSMLVLLSKHEIEKNIHVGVMKTMNNDVKNLV